MQREYITEYNGNFNCTKFTLSTGTEVVLSEYEQEELSSLLGNYGEKLQQAYSKINNLKDKVHRFDEWAVNLTELISYGKKVQKKWEQ